MSTTETTTAAPAESIQTPARIITHWKRFACGLWRLPRGDIAVAYCADIFPKLKVFTHEGRLFTSAGNCFTGVVQTTSCCYALITPHEYTGPQSVRYSYEGKEGQYSGRKWRLGPKI